MKARVIELHGRTCEICGAVAGWGQVMFHKNKCPSVTKLAQQTSDTAKTPAKSSL